MIQEETLLHHLKSPTTKEEAFRVLLSEFKERLYWHIRKIVLNHEDTDDVLQNTFIKVYKNIEKFKGDSKLYTWMYRIATNEALSFLSKKAKRLKITNEDLQQYSLNNLKADVYFEGDTIQLKLQEALASLPQKQQLVFNMKYFDNIKYDDLSKILDTSVGALKSSYHIAVKKITKYLETH